MQKDGHAWKSYFDWMRGTEPSIILVLWAGGRSFFIYKKPS
jgi:hypothetical protein